jgi:hypothetical protein
VGSVLAIVVVIVVGYGVYAIFRARRRSLVPKRGLGVGADLGGLADAPRVRVRSVTRMSSDRVRVVFEPEEGSDMEFAFSLPEDDFGSTLLEEWQRDGSPIAMVIPPDSPLVRLRSVESLQHLTLRRASA